MKNTKQDYIIKKTLANKRQSGGVIELLKKQGDYKTAQKIADCSKQITFVGYVNDPNRVNVLTHRCGDSKLCSICGDSRKHKLGKKAQDKIDATGVHEMIARHYVLSIENTDDIEAGFNDIHACKSELSNAIRSSKKSEFYNVSGYMGSIELSRDNNGYHPHIHLITFSAVELNERKLRGSWRRIARKIAGTTANIDTPTIDSTQHMKNITSYMNKQLSLSDAELIEYKRITKHKNLFFTGGFLYGVPVPTNKLDASDDEQKMFSFYEIDVDGESYNHID